MSSSLSSEEVEVARSDGEGDGAAEVVGAEETAASVVTTVESTEARTGDVRSVESTEARTSEGRRGVGDVLSNWRASTERVEMTVAGGRD